MPDIEAVDEQRAREAYERWLATVREGAGAVANGEPDVFLAGWLAGRDFQDGYRAGLAAAKDAK